MPTAIHVDPESVRSLWLQGFTHKDIEEKTGVKSGTLRTWIVRKGWKKEGVKVQPVDHDAHVHACKSIAQRLADEVVTQCDRILCCIRDTKIDSLRDCKEASSAIAASYATARKALGLDDDRQQVHLHLHALGSTRAAQVAESPVIDVSPAIPATPAPEIPQ